MREILVRGEDFIFSYRVAGLLLRDGALLMQSAGADPALAIPGGHVELFETSAESLVREFREELSVNITVGALKWVGELFWRWGDKPCHQIGLYYEVFLREGELLPATTFDGQELMDGETSALHFHWIPLTSLPTLEVYPVALPKLIAQWDAGVQHFIEKQ